MCVCVVGAVLGDWRRTSVGASGCGPELARVNATATGWALCVWTHATRSGADFATVNLIVAD